MVRSPLWKALMVVTCPSCSARYKLPDSKVTGRGARVTCPKCRNAFVVRPESPSQTAKESLPTAEVPVIQPPNPKATRDFQTHGVLWHVRLRSGATHEVTTLQELLDGLATSRFESDAALTYDMRSWRVISDIPDLPAWFDMIWDQAASGTLHSAHEDEDEDEDDAATQLAGKNSALAEEIRRALADTPEPPAPRSAPPFLDEPVTDPHADQHRFGHDRETVPPSEGRMMSPDQEYAELEEAEDLASPTPVPVAPPAPAPAPVPSSAPAPPSGRWGVGALLGAVAIAVVLGLVVVLVLE